jgi:hypothetical protein
MNLIQYLKTFLSAPHYFLYILILFLIRTIGGERVSQISEGLREGGGGGWERQEP